MNKFQKWCAKERVGRVEEGTSQDMCPTNGDSLIMSLVMGLIGLLIAICIIFRGI